MAKPAQQIIKKGKKDGGKGGGGSNKKDGSAGEKQVCFSYGRRRDGPSCQLALGNETRPNDRLHERELCHKKDHFSKDCPKKPARIKDW